MPTQRKRLKIINNGQFHNKYGTVISETSSAYSVRLDGAGMFNRVNVQQEDAQLIPLKKSFSFIVYSDEPHRNRSTLNLDIAGFLNCGEPEPVDVLPADTVGIAGHSIIPPMTIGSTFRVR